MQTDSEESLLLQLDSELNDSWERLKEIRAALQRGEIGLENYNKAKLEIEAHIEDITNRIQYIQKAKQKIPSLEERVIHEAELLMNEYQVELIDEKIYHLRIYLTVSVHQTWIIEINFANPKVPLLKIPSDLPLLIGDPYLSLNSLRNWKGSLNEYIIDIIREIENTLLDLELKKSMPELELERGRVMDKAKKLEQSKEYSRALVFYNYAADISERIGDQAIAMVCRLKAKKMLDLIKK
ncbi:MAG: hypothetical protein ACTSRS_17950 [Candidatus Helarchaeota archaeon]